MKINFKKNNDFLNKISYQQYMQKRINSIFSDTLMIGLALLIIPIVIAKSFIHLTTLQEIIVNSIDLIIWFIFLLEFVFKLFVNKEKMKWLTINKVDTIVSIIVILSPILEYFEHLFLGAPLLRLLRITRIIRLGRLTRLLRLFSLIVRVKNAWNTLGMKNYVLFFLIVGSGTIASFANRFFKHSPIDTLWLSLFIQAVGVFYAILVSFFVVHVWGKYNSISSEINNHINSLSNLMILADNLYGNNNKQIKSFHYKLSSYVDYVLNNFWYKKNVLEENNDKNHFSQLFQHFNTVKIRNEREKIILNNVITELRTSSIAQSNLTNLATDTTPKILWILLLLLSFFFSTSFVIVGFENQLLATLVSTSISILSGLIIALMYDIDTPFDAGFWQITSSQYEKFKKSI